MGKDSSLDGLLSGLGGVEGDILKSKRQAMASSVGQTNGRGQSLGRQGATPNEKPETKKEDAREEEVHVVAGAEFSPGYLDVEQLLVETELAGERTGKLGAELDDVSIGDESQGGGVHVVDDFLAGIYGGEDRGEAGDDTGDLLGGGFGTSTTTTAMPSTARETIAEPMKESNIETRFDASKEATTTATATATQATTTEPTVSVSRETSQYGEKDAAHFAQYHYQGLNHGEDLDVTLASSSPTRLSPVRLSPRKSPKRSTSPTFHASLSPPKSPTQHHTMADMGHKAAKGLQNAKNWLFSASKTIARDVQSRIEAHKEKSRRDGGGHRRRPSIIESPPSDFVPEEHHQLWAQQLVHAPPETQAAALDAMEDYDRLAVQQVIDEMIWYENRQRERVAVENRSDNVGSGVNASSSPPHQQPRPRQTPDLLNDSPDLLHPARPPPPPPPAASAIQESFDLLNLDDDHGAPDAIPPGQDIDPAHPHPPTPPTIVSNRHTDPSPSREQLKAQRLAREQKRIEDMVASARDQVSRDASEKEEKVAIRERLRPEIDAWTNNKKDNIRSLLCTMETVLWSGSAWKSPSVVDLMEPGQVRKWYMKANLVVHPDKVKQSHGSLEQLTRAEMIFDVLQQAWGKFS